MKISFCLITLNEEENLARCLQSCSDLAHEIVIVDSGSVDGTEKIAQQFQARLRRQDWLGYVAQKNLALSLAQHEWVFSIDADEELSPQLRAEILFLKNSAGMETAGFSMPRCVFYEGKWIRHGDWYPDRIVRLFQKSKAHFVGGQVHECLEVAGPVQKLQGELHHYSFRDATDHWTRCQKYARLWAETQREKGRRATPWTPFLRAGFRWVRGYILKRGFLDGKTGLRIANFCAREVFLKYQLLRAPPPSSAR
ncbi:MAG: glycosyltransferase family 2 protein [Verrucomicrobiota bacterium]|nr:glycosyltransferase family 2 protein [Verrucomicrobiota bacterium]